MKYDPFLQHEMLDRTYLLLSMFNDFIAEHPMALHPKLRDDIKHLEDQLANLYQKIGALDA